MEPKNNIVIDKHLAIDVSGNKSKGNESNHKLEFKTTNVITTDNKKFKDYDLYQNDDLIQLDDEMNERDINLIHCALSNHFLFKDKTDLIM